MEKQDYNPEAAEISMQNALAPRNKDGLIIPMSFLNEPEIALYPVRVPNDEGLVKPIWFAEEFANGRVPPDLRYEEGCRFPGESNGFVLENVVFRNPGYNLPPSQLTPSVGLCLGEMPRDSRKQSALDVEVMMDGQIVADSTGGLLLRTAKGDFPLCNFQIKATEHRIVHGNEPQPNMEFEMVVCCKGKERKLTLPAKDIDNLVKRVQIALPDCTVTATIPKAIPSIVNYVRQQFSDLSEHHYLKCTGFQRVADHWIYVQDCAIPPSKNIHFITGRSIRSDTTISPEAAWRIATDFLHLSPKTHMLVPLFLMAHLGPLFNLFEVSGCVPRFIIFLNGRSGSLKTSMVMTLFRLFWEQNNSPGATFMDTETALEIKLGQAQSSVLVVDDYRPPVIAVAGKMNLSKLESLIRYVGDHIPKSRSNADLGRAREFRPTGCCVVTGEDTGGSHSSLLRCLVLAVSKGDIDGKRLRRYQDNPMLLMTHMHHFLQWCGQRGDEVIHFIQSAFQEEREIFQNVCKELRLVDTAATLMTTARILTSYGKACGALKDDTMGLMVLAYREEIKQAVAYSESFSKEMNPVYMYLRAFFDLWDNHGIQVAPDIGSFVPGKMIGYGDGDSLWLCHRELYSKVKKYWQRFDVLFPLSAEKTSEHLADAGWIEVSFESRGESTKRLYSKKSSLPSRTRLMVLNAVLARRYMEEEMGNY